MKSTLYDWQQPSADRLVDIFSKGGLVALDASDMGSGKTYISLEVASRLKWPVLIICPKATKTSWARVAESFGVKPIGIITPQRLLHKNPFYVNKAWVLPTDCFIIWDEVQKGTSGPDTKTTLALGRTKVYRIPVLAMSATIAETPLKLRGLGFLLGLHDFNKSSFKRWCLAHACFPSPFAMGKLEFSKSARGNKALAQIHAQISDRMVRIRREDIPDFPLGLIESKLIDLDKDYAAQVDGIYKDLDQRLKEPGANAMVERGKAREKVECYKVPVMVELIMEALEEGLSPVVAVNFHSAREALIAALTEKKILNVSQIHGRQSETEQTKHIDAFQDNTNHTCVVITAAGGTGTNLHDLNGRPRCTFVTPSDNAVDVVQFLGRTHRTGGTAVVQTFLLAANTVEEKVHRNIQRKLTNIKTLNDGDLTI
jgi:SNF2 family DNA or RNA helicase